MTDSLSDLSLPLPSFTWADTRVLVTGGTGFIGCHLLRRLVAEGARPVVLVRDAQQPNRLQDLRSHLRFIEGDLRNLPSASTCEASFADGPPQVVFHLAAAGVENPLEDWLGAIEANISGTSHLLQLCSEWKSELQAFVYTGTPFEYGVGEGARHEDSVLKPPNFYAASKAAGWLFCQTFASLHDLPVVGVRPFLTYGPDQGTRRLVPATILSALNEREISLTGGTQSRDFVYIDDVVEGLLRAACALSASTCNAGVLNLRGEMFNLGSGTGHRLQFVVQRILGLSGSRARPSFGALPFRKGEIWDLRADTTKAQQMLGWQAQIGLDDGLERTIAWYRDNLHTFSL